MPANPRDSARMLVVSDSLFDEHIHNLLDHLQAGDVMVFNDTRVIPARLMGKRGEASIEVLLHKCITPAKAGAQLWRTFCKPAKKLKIGDEVIFAEDFSAIVIEKLESGEVILDLDPRLRGDWKEKLAQYGQMPLPPYIEKKRHADATDNAHYQTVYAKHEGSVAAPTAGLHFIECTFDC